MNLAEYVIDENSTIVEAMRKLDKVAAKVLYILDGSKIAASLTDGDIRRWLLKKNKIDAKVKEVANYSPLYLHQKDKRQASKLMKKYMIESVPIVNDDKEIILIMFWNDHEVDIDNDLNLPVVIMAGGKGTRLYPYTKILPKPLIPIGEKPIIEHIIDRFNMVGCDVFYLLINHKKNMIKAYFNEEERAYTTKYIEEEEFLGTGGGLSLLKGMIDSTFILSNCDILIEENYSKMYEHHKREKNMITMVCSLKTIKIPYGVVETTESGSIEKVDEKPEVAFFVNTGMYIVEPEVIENLKENRVVGFPTVIQEYKQAGKKVGVYPISDYAWMDMGQIEEMEIMRNRLGENE